MNSDLVVSDFVPAKEEGNTVPLCRAKPSPSFINLQASSPPVTFLKILPTKLLSGKEGGREDFPNRLSNREGFMDEVAGAFFYWFWCWPLGPGTFRFFAGSLLIIQFCWFHFLPDFTSSFVCLFCLLMPLLDWQDWNKTFIACLVMLVKKWLGKEIVTISSVSLHFSYSSSHREISACLAYLWEAKQSTQFSSLQFSRSVLSDSLRPHESQHARHPVHHQLLEFTQTHVHRVGDAIQPSHPLSSSPPPAPNPSQHQGLFQWVNSSHEVAKVLEFQLQHQSFQWTPRTDLLECHNSWVWGPQGLTKKSRPMNIQCINNCQG